MATILISGGNGLIGKHLTKSLQKAGHAVCWLVRNPDGSEPVKAFAWNPAEHKIAAEALNGVDAIVALAGAPIAGSPWTKDYKQTILQSRLDAAETLLGALKKFPHSVKSLVSASAIGFYGNRGAEVLDEESAPGEGFLSQTTKQWEDAYANCPVRNVTLRIGIVLSRDGGALPELEKPLNFGIASVLGNGKQLMSWIHMEDLCNIFIRAITDSAMKGKYNGVAPFPESQSDFIRTLRKIVRPVSLIVPAPAFAIRLLLGEQASLVLDSASVSCDRLLDEGFRFTYPRLKEALLNLYEKN
jgi:uncharacterized protein